RGAAQWHARGFAWPPPSAPAVSRRSPSPRTLEDYSADSAEQCPVRKERHHSRGGSDKDFRRAQDALPPPPGEVEMLLWPRPPPSLGALKYGRNRGSKAGHESGRVGNMLRKTTGHARSLGPIDRLPRAVSFSRHC